uniref:NADP-dependent oxidoreductase domain-containing protein n=1 Tax=Plectus sambesii TaxID=2011161 RepID=A0A914WK48_9BILA
MTVVPTLTLKSGEKMPVIGLGTWQSKPGEVGQALKIALKNGYRHFDCAHVYMNQDEIGQVLEEAIAQGLVKREELFITSKIWNTFHSYEKTKEAVDIILQQLKLKYIDLLLIHSPMGYQEGEEMFPWTEDGNRMHFSDVDYLDTWKALEEAVQAGKVKTIGLSNFNSQQIQRVIDHSHIQPAVLQVELHPYFQQTKLVNFCKEKGIEVTAYSPLGSMTAPFRKEGQANLLEDPVILEIAKHHNKSPAQVAIRWSIQRGLIVIPKSTNEHRIKENFDVFDFELSKDEMAKMAGIDRNWRIFDLAARNGDHKYYPYIVEF